MSFAAFEVSTESSRPIEIFLIEMGTETFRYTSGEDEVVVSLETYEPEAIKRSSVSDGPEERATSLTLQFPATNDFVRRFISVVPGPRAKITISRLQRPDFPGPEVIVMFVGYVRSVAFREQGHVAEVSTAPIVAATSRPLPRQMSNSLCNHVLYDDSCKVDSSDSAFRLNGTVSAVSGSTVTVPGASTYPDGWFQGGFLEAQGGADARLILDHVGDVLTLLLPFPFNAVGQLVTVFAGCDHTTLTCDGKFYTVEDPLSNLLNFGGFPFVPNKNIFESGLD